MLTKWLGVIEATVMFCGLAGLVTGMHLLAAKPLPGVVVMLASMAVIASSAGKLCEAQELRLETNATRERFSRGRVTRSR